MSNTSDRTVLQRRRHGAAFLFVCLFLLSAQKPEDVSLHAPLPAGWRYPTALELRDPIRDTSPHRYAKTVADFDGNGHQDIAVLLRKENSNAEGLWVWLAQDLAGQWIKLDSDEDKEGDGRVYMGLDRKESGALTVKCIEQNAACAVNGSGEPALLWLKNPGIDYFRFSSASSVFYWDAKQSKFLRAWISD